MRAGMQRLAQEHRLATFRDGLLSSEDEYSGSSDDDGESTAPIGSTLDAADGSFKQSMPAAPQTPQRWAAAKRMVSCSAALNGSAEMRRLATRGASARDGTRSSRPPARRLSITADEDRAALFAPFGKPPTPPPKPDRILGRCSVELMMTPCETGDRRASAAAPAVEAGVATPRLAVDSPRLPRGGGEALTTSALQPSGGWGSLRGGLNAASFVSRASNASKRSGARRGSKRASSADVALWKATADLEKMAKEKVRAVAPLPSSSPHPLPDRPPPLILPAAP